MPKASDLHALEPEDFLEEVHSFQHWFESVQGYLADTHFGHTELAEQTLSRKERDRLVTALCNYTVGETAALEVSSALVQVAPNRHAKIFLATQVVDEGRHVEVILHRMSELGVADPEAEVERRASRSIQDFKSRLVDLANAGDWEAAIFAQNVVLEAMEFTVFRAHARVADPVTRDMLERIIRDERRHIGFGENELGRRLERDRKLGARLSTLKAELDPMVLGTFEETLDEIGLPPADRPQLGRDYLQAVARLGVG